MLQGDPISVIRASVADAVARLTEAGVADEPLAEYEDDRRMLRLIRLSPRMRPIARVWRLGVFLVDRDQSLWVGGASTRAVSPGRANYQSVSGEQRRAHRDAAHRGPFEEGETVNFGARRVELSPEGLAAAPDRLLIVDGQPRVRWSPAADAASAIPFDRYLRERVDLLIDPPGGV